jgi:mono/diheme cytochrome c family protein
MSRSGRCPRGATAALAGCVIALAIWPVVKAQTRTVADGVYSAGQAQRGAALYKEHCSACHGAQLQGVVGPPLTGADFLSDFDKQPLAALVGKVRNTMPANKPGSLTPAQVVDVVAHILQVGSFPAGGAELSADDGALQAIRWPPPAGDKAPRPPSTVDFPPVARLSQVMKGILFPSSNIIFNVQTRDPADQKSYEAGKADFSLVDWGAGVYKGWELVDNAAMAIAEAAPLLLTPDRRCENGRRVPVERADWIKFTRELVEAAQAAYTASQMRSQMAVSDATERLSDACFSCHIVYRDKGAGPPEDPSNKAARCAP